LAIDPRFKWADEFCNELAVAEDENGLSGFVDRHGEWVIAPSFDHVCRPFEDGEVAVACQSPKYGVIDRSGGWVVEPRFEEGMPFLEGIAAFKVDGLWGFIDAKGSWRIQPKFAEVSSFEDGLAKAREGEHWGVIDSHGKWILPPECDSELHIVTVDGVVWVKQGRFWNSQFSSIEDYNGRFPDYNEGLSAADEEDRADCGFVDKYGEWVIPPQFEDTKSFSEGLAAVKQDGLWGFIDKTGQFVIRPQFHHLEWNGSFHDSAVAIQDVADRTVPVLKREHESDLREQDE
jgi:hypothetical protein